jgi:hypothetical protein
MAQALDMKLDRLTNIIRKLGLGRACRYAAIEAGRISRVTRFGFFNNY